MHNLLKDSQICDVIALKDFSGDSRTRAMVFGNTSYVEEYFLPFLASLKLYAPDLLAHLHIINPDWQIIAKLARISQIVNQDFALTIELMPENIKDFNRIYCSNIRFHRIGQFLRLYQQPIIAFDIDSIFVSKFYFTSAFQPCDFALYSRLHIDKVQFKTLVSTVYFNPTAPADGFLQVYSQYFVQNFSQNKLFFYFDQVAMGQILPEFAANYKINFHPLEKAYIDWDFNPDSLVWNGKGSRKFENQLYKLINNRLVNSYQL